MKSVPVSTRALVQRLNRTLSKKGEVIKSGRGKAATLGYYVLNFKKGIVDKNINLESFGRKYSALEPWEQLKD